MSESSSVPSAVCENCGTVHVFTAFKVVMPTVVVAGSHRSIVAMVLDGIVQGARRSLIGKICHDCGQPVIDAIMAQIGTPTSAPITPVVAPVVVPVAQASVPAPVPTPVSTPTPVSAPKATGTKPIVASGNKNGIMTVVNAILNGNGLDWAEKIYVNGVQKTQCVVAKNQPKSCVCDDNGLHDWSTMPTISAGAAHFGFGQKCASEAVTAIKLAGLINPFSGKMLDESIRGYKTVVNKPSVSSSVVADPMGDGIRFASVDKVVKALGIKKPKYPDTFDTVEQGNILSVKLEGLSKVFMTHVYGEESNAVNMEVLVDKVEDTGKGWIVGDMDVFRAFHITTEVAGKLSKLCFYFSTVAKDEVEAYKQLQFARDGKPTLTLVPGAVLGKTAKQRLAKQAARDAMREEAEQAAVVKAAAAAKAKEDLANGTTPVKPPARKTKVKANGGK